jgi:YVTN family beta-propeller protein
MACGQEESERRRTFALVRRFATATSGVGLVAVPALLFAQSASASPTPIVTTTIPVGSYPESVAVDSSTGTVYVADTGNIEPAPGFVSVISEATDSVIDTVPVGDNPGSVSVDPSTGTVYVASGSSNTVSVISEATNTVTDTIPVGQSPSGVAVDSDTGTVYVTNQGDSTVSVISETTDTVTTTIPVGFNPSGVAVDPSTGTVYVVNADDTGGASVASGGVSVISEASDTVVANIPLPNAYDIAVDPATDTVYVGTADGLSIISGATDAVTGNVSNNNVVTYAVKVDPTTSMVYAGTSENTVVAISEATDTVTATIPVGEFPESLGLDSSTGRVYVANLGDNTVSVLTVEEDVSNGSGTGTVGITSQYQLIGRTVTVQGTGTGSVTVGQYHSPPVTALPNTAYIDVEVQSGSSFTSLMITVCGGTDSARPNRLVGPRS